MQVEAIKGPQRREADRRRYEKVDRHNVLTFLKIYTLFINYDPVPPDRQSEYKRIRSAHGPS